MVPFHIGQVQHHGKRNILLGVLILASGIQIRNLLTTFDRFGDSWKAYNTCQYWAGIPTILTGGVLVLSVLVNRHQSLKYISLCCAAITMVLTLGIIIQESGHALSVHYVVLLDGRCDDINDSSEYYKDCLKFMEADPWYYTMLFGADIVLVLCSLVTLLLFGDWIIFVLPRTSSQNYEVTRHHVSGYQGHGLSQLSSNDHYDPNAISLNTV
ncbi:uncharacterized protein LOC114521727 [Dendronephthya gigantea]|uniref:uncharacterized protein LOC114521727 n=1 Tax=Dendronephthya gigantea TaxID=151771 RepID=UPI001068F781|nr:uncharacterized protein LOC114521727 [Dendronephthya gigantea]